MAEKYIDSFLTDLKLSLPSFENLVYKDYVVIVPRMKLWRAKQFALHKLERNYIDQYANIGRYAEEIRRTNTSSTIVCKLDSGLFERMYVCLKACVDGFKHCRPFISLDGCHLKEKCGGQLLAVVGIDANECIFPIAFAVVETESTETWTWFINRLSEDINMENPYSWT